MALQKSNQEEILAIIGGGAAGLAAAIAAGRAVRARGESMQVIIYEARERVGQSILATGNGRCNFSNALVEHAVSSGAEVYRNQAFVTQALSELRRFAEEEGTLSTETNTPENAVLSFFASLGLLWREEGEGRLYPLANKASSILDVLRAAAQKAGVVQQGDSKVIHLDPPLRKGDSFTLRFADGSVAGAQAVIVAAGGKASSALLPPNISAVPSVPLLGPLRTQTTFLKSLNNIRVRATVSLVDASGYLKVREEGEVLFRDYGVSGIAVFNLSRFALAGDKLLIDLLPQVSIEACEPFLKSRCAQLGAAEGGLSGAEVLRGMLLPAVADAVLKAAHLKSEAPLRKQDLEILAHALKAFSLEVKGLGDERQCQVHRGGAEVRDFDPLTMESRVISNFYVVGEALDVDAPCGGYNLHWAWASGMLAGIAAAMRAGK